MRTLSSDLLSAQKSLSHVPHVKVEVLDQIAGVARLSFQRLYTGAEIDNRHAATMPGDGSLLRAYVNASSHLLYQRAANPGESSDFAVYSDLGLISSVASIALASRGATALLFYVHTDNRTIRVRESADNGATLGSPIDITTTGLDVGWMAAAINPSGVVCLLFSEGGATIKVVKRTGGTWGSPTSWTNSLSNVTGIACVHQGDWNVVVAGQDTSGNFGVWSAVFGDGYSQSVGAWSSLKEIMFANSGSNVTYKAPFLAYYGVFRAFFVEEYTASQTYTRAYWSESPQGVDFINNRWREPVPFNLEGAFGVAMAHSSSNIWLSVPYGVWRALLTPASVDVTADVLSLEMTDAPTGGSARIQLRNDDGRYSSLGSGAYAAIKLGSEVQISPGYQTSTGPRVSSGPAFWITGWEYASEGGHASLTLHAADGWGLLERWIARRQFTFPSGSQNVFQILAFVMARAGLSLTTLSNSSALVNHYLLFTINPEESGARVVKRLLAMVPDVLFFRGRTGYIVNPQATDSSVYSYGTDHPILAAHYRAQPQPINRAQVYGGGIFLEALAWSQVELVYDRIAQVHDLNLTTTARAQERASAELRASELMAQGGQVAVPANAGQELYDVISITDPRAGLSGALRRVLSLQLEHDRRPGRQPRYQQRLTLGGV